MHHIVTVLRDRTTWRPQQEELFLSLSFQAIFTLRYNLHAAIFKDLLYRTGPLSQFGILRQSYAKRNGTLLLISVHSIS